MFLKHNYTTDELIRRCCKGERQAQELLYRQFASKMLGVCMRYATDQMEAEDMLQNGFIKVFQKIADFRGEGSFEGWMRRIMVHCSIEYYRRHHKMLQVAELDERDEPAVDAAALTRLNANDLLKLIGELSPGYRMVFNLYAIEGFSHREISSIMDISEGASKSQLSRARTILKEKVLQQEGKKYEHAG